MDELEKEIAKRSIELILKQVKKLCDQAINMGNLEDGPLALIFKVLAITSKTISSELGIPDEMIEVMEGFDLKTWKETSHKTLPVTSTVKVSDLNKQLDDIIANAKR